MMHSDFTSGDLAYVRDTKQTCCTKFSTRFFLQSSTNFFQDQDSSIKFNNKKLCFKYERSPPNLVVLHKVFVKI